MNPRGSPPARHRVIHNVPIWALAAPLNHDAAAVLIGGSGAVLVNTFHDAVGIDADGDLDLRYALRRRRDPDQVEHAQLLAISRYAAGVLADGPELARPVSSSWTSSRAT
jgi:NAD-specific glutamate dehydrogenase